MNKTVNINLGGMFFHIDEDAYQKLTRYFEAIKKSLSNTNGQDEIIKDIEMRIAELIAEKHTNEKQVISIKELDEIIAVMGQPEDYRIDTDETTENRTFNASRVTKKLYRDKENAVLGGVTAGLAHYFGIDKAWLRIAIVFLVLFYGVGIMAYIILWIVIPEAITTTEKLEMTGEPITISNIEKKVREEFDNVSEKFKNANYDKMGNQVKTGAEKFATSIGDVFMAIFKVFAKFLGVILVIIALPVLVMLLIGVFTLGTTLFIDFPWKGFIEAGNYSDYPIWSFGLLMFFAIGIPFFYLMLLGFKLLITNIKTIGNVANYTLLALWIISVTILASIGISQLTQFAVEGRMIQKETINLKPKDTLKIKFIHNDDFAKDIDENHDFMITQDSVDNNVIYSNKIDLKIERTDERTAFLQIEKQAKGQSLSEAKKTAEKIKYGYKLVGNQLILDNYLLTEFKNKYRNQEVEITLFLPKGTLFKADRSIQKFDSSNNEYFNFHYNADSYLYFVDENQVKCITCPSVDNEYKDVENNSETIDTTITTTTSVKVNGEEVIIQETTNKKGLTIDKNGTIIKK